MGSTSGMLISVGGVCCLLSCIAKYAAPVKAQGPDLLGTARTSGALLGRPQPGGQRNEMPRKKGGRAPGQCRTVPPQNCHPTSNAPARLKTPAIIPSRESARKGQGEGKRLRAPLNLQWPLPHRRLKHVSRVQQGSHSGLRTSAAPAAAPSRAARTRCHARRGL